MSRLYINYWEEMYQTKKLRFHWYALLWATPQSVDIIGGCSTLYVFLWSCCSCCGVIEGAILWWSSCVEEPLWEGAIVGEEAAALGSRTVEEPYCEGSAAYRCSIVGKTLPLPHYRHCYPRIKYSCAHFILYFNLVKKWMKQELQPWLCSADIKTDFKHFKNKSNLEETLKIYYINFIWFMRCMSHNSTLESRCWKTPCVIELTTHHDHPQTNVVWTSSDERGVNVLFSLRFDIETTYVRSLETTQPLKVQRPATWGDSEVN